MTYELFATAAAAKDRTTDCGKRDMEHTCATFGTHAYGPQRFLEERATFRHFTLPSGNGAPGRVSTYAEPGLCILRGDEDAGASDRTGIGVTKAVEEAMRVAVVPINSLLALMIDCCLRQKAKSLECPGVERSYVEWTKGVGIVSA